MMINKYDYYYSYFLDRESSVISPNWPELKATKTLLQYLLQLDQIKEGHK